MKHFLKDERLFFIFCVKLKQYIVAQNKKKTNRIYRENSRLPLCFDENFAKPIYKLQFGSQHFFRQINVSIEEVTKELISRKIERYCVL